MKYSFSTLGCPEWSYEKVLSEAQRMGFTGLEIRGIDGVMRADKIPQLSKDQLPETKRELAEKGLEIIGFGTSCRFHSPEEYGAAVEEGKRAIDVCADAGIPFIRVFGDQIKDESEQQEVIGRVAKGIRELCDYAAGTPVMVLQEVHGNFNRLETIMGVVEKVKDCPNFGLIWDIAHSDKTYGDDWKTFYQGIRSYIRHVHIKDHIREKGFSLCLVGDGDIPIKDIVHTLESDGYHGYYSIEWEKLWHPDLPDAEIAFPGFLEYMKAL